MIALDLPKKAQGPFTLFQAEHPLQGIPWGPQGCPLCQLSQQTALAAEHLPGRHKRHKHISERSPNRHQTVPVLSLCSPLELKLGGCAPYSLPSATQGTERTVRAFSAPAAVFGHLQVRNAACFCSAKHGGVTAQQGKGMSTDTSHPLARESPPKSPLNKAARPPSSSSPLKV